ncbi:MAG: hypothetical protein IJH36_06175 [Clostridia bacterium]|nr:hypothetical protein [Clostridia bacterium]
MNTARRLYGEQLKMPQLDYYPARDRRLIADRVVRCILIRQKWYKDNK